MDPFWYAEYTGGDLTIASAPMDFKPAILYYFDTYKLHHRDIYPNNFWQTWHTAGQVSTSSRRGVFFSGITFG